MATTATALATVMKGRARVQSSEGISDATLESLITAGLTEHNPSLTFATLPTAQEELVILLGWIRLCVVRAGKAAQEGNLSGPSGYGQDRNTPYYKNMDLAKNLRAQYDSLAKSLGLAATQETQSVVVSDLLKPAVVHRGEATSEHYTPAPPVPVLALETDLNTEAVLIWTFPHWDQFYSFILFTSDSTTEQIYQDWNMASQTTTPRISNLATKLIEWYDNDVRAVKVTDLDRAKDQRFLLVVRSKTDTYSYSNEVVIEIPVPPAP